MNNQNLKPSVLFRILLLLLGLAVPGVMLAQASAEAKAATQNQPRWETLAPGMTEGISGLAWVEHESKKTVLLAVHDNKEPGQKRLSLITRGAAAHAESKTLSWAGEQPKDLEAICRLPGEERGFLALTSKGALFRLALEQGMAEVRVLLTGNVPHPGKELEAFDVQRVAGKLIATWGERGDKSPDGIIHFALFDPAALEFSECHSAKIRAPWPTVHTRHISDLRLLTDGTVLVASASDPDIDDGPFSGAVYVAGSIVIENDHLRFVANDKPARLYVTHERKIEALEFIPGPDGGMVLGSDDENKGGAIYFGW